MAGTVPNTAAVAVVEAEVPRRPPTTAILSTSSAVLRLPILGTAAAAADRRRRRFVVRPLDMPPPRTDMAGVIIPNRPRDRAGWNHRRYRRRPGRDPSRPAEVVAAWTTVLRRNRRTHRRPIRDTTPARRLRDIEVLLPLLLRITVTVRHPHTDIPTLHRRILLLLMGTDQDRTVGQAVITSSWGAAEEADRRHHRDRRVVVEGARVVAASVAVGEMYCVSPLGRTWQPRPT
mmetsp:Transcript_36911/g.80373  ORF Transcript_36911/g.80373 Transcript_36911/m.80373 type:complete len:232 (-) Transcript_36911:980-1675(-)